MLWEDTTKITCMSMQPSYQINVVKFSKTEKTERNKFVSMWTVLHTVLRITKHEYVIQRTHIVFVNKDTRCSFHVGLHRVHTRSGHPCAYLGLAR